MSLKRWSGFGAHANEHVVWVQGKALTAGVRQVHVDFVAAFAAVQKVEYDLTDCAESRWAGDHGRFQTALRDLERRLSHLVVVVRLPKI